MKPFQLSEIPSEIIELKFDRCNSRYIISKRHQISHQIFLPHFLYLNIRNTPPFCEAFVPKVAVFIQRNWDFFHSFSGSVPYLSFQFNTLSKRQQTRMKETVNCLNIVPNCQHLPTKGCSHYLEKIVYQILKSRKIKCSRVLLLCSSQFLCEIVEPSNFSCIYVVIFSDFLNVTPLSLHTNAEC